MSFDIIQTTLSAAVATNGTFTVAYPAGKSAATYTGAHNHKMAALQTIYLSPASFSLSFGASSITVTYIGLTTLPAGTAVDLSVDRLGTDDGRPNAVKVNSRVVNTSLRLLDLGAPITADADGVSASQSVALGANFVINGALAAGGAVVFDTPRNVVAAWTTTAILTIYGTDVDDKAMVEKSASGTSHTGKKAFKTVTRVSSSASITGATVGSGVVIGLPAYVPDASWVVTELMDGAALPRPAGKVFLPWEIEATELAAGTAEELVVPVAGYVSKVRATVQSAVTTGGPVTVKIGTSAITGLTFTVADADAAGTRYSDAPTTRHGSDSLVAAGDRIQIVPDAAFATAGQLNGIIEIDVTPIGQLDGTFVAAVASVGTGTTGDTRGTYSPSVTPDGTHSFALLVAMPGPDDQGVPQYTG